MNVAETRFIDFVNSADPVQMNLNWWQSLEINDIPLHRTLWISGSCRAIWPSARFRMFNLGQQANEVIGEHPQEMYGLLFLWSARRPARLLWPRHVRGPRHKKNRLTCSVPCIATISIGMLSNHIGTNNASGLSSVGDAQNKSKKRLRTGTVLHFNSLQITQNISTWALHTKKSASSIRLCNKSLRNLIGFQFCNFVSQGGRFGVLARRTRFRGLQVLEPAIQSCQTKVQTCAEKIKQSPGVNEIKLYLFIKCGRRWRPSKYTAAKGIQTIETKGPKTFLHIQVSWKDAALAETVRACKKASCVVSRWVPMNSANFTYWGDMTTR